MILPLIFLDVIAAFPGSMKNTDTERSISALLSWVLHVERFSTPAESDRLARGEPAAPSFGNSLAMSEVV